MSHAIADAERPKGPPFVKFYPRGLERIRALLDFKGGPTVGKLWLFSWSIAATIMRLSLQSTWIAESLGVNERSVRRAAAVLQAGGALVIAKIGNANAYILNDGEVWKTYEDHHRFCGFRARALVGFKENPGFRARVSHLLPQGDLPLDEGGAA